MGSYNHLKNCKIHYEVSGTGCCVVFLHGYLENLSIWDDYSTELSKKFKVVRVDLPGHGESVSNLDNLTMDYMADAVNAVVENLNIPKCAVIGHSMGGYVSLAFAERYPEKTAGLCLFHSTPYPDSDEKKLSRNRDIDLVTLGRKEEIVNASIPRLFAANNLKSFQKEVDQAKKMALSTSDKGIIGALQGMASRPDRNHVLESMKCPSMMIFGVKDNLTSVEVMKSLAGKHKKTRTVYLNNSGHMGFIEERDYALKAIISFLNEVFN